MRKIKIKICGMKYPGNILEVSSLLPDYMGFIFWKKSTRYFEGIIPELPKSIKKTGVFVGATPLEIYEKVKQYHLQAVQLHGNELPEICKQLKRLLPDVEIIKVFSINEDFDFKHLDSFEKVCDYYLFDTKGKLPGGNGHTFDWKILNHYPSAKPFFLSGGIGTETLEKVTTLLKANLPVYAIDLNSKLEIEPGLKNINSCKRVFKYFSQTTNKE